MDKITKDFLQKNYVDGSCTYNEIAEILGVSKSVVMYWAKKHCIKSRPGGRKKIIFNSGKKFGSLTVIKEAPPREDGHIEWECKCDCGDICRVQTSSLVRGQKYCWKCRNGRIGEALWKGHGEISGDFWGKIQKSAEVRNIDFDVTIEEIWDLFLKQNRKCALSGMDIKFVRGKDNRSKITASLDRIDSRESYTLDNIQWVHKTINNIKMNLDQSEFVDWCEKVTEYAAKKTNR